jgi:hypothetical protein
MPTGMVIMQFSEKSGVNVLGKYPSTLKVVDKTLMQVYSTHEYSGELGMVSLMEGTTNIASYYLSKEMSCYLLLYLSSGEEPDAFEGGMAEAARTIIPNIESDTLPSLIPSIYALVSKYPTMKPEQRLALMFQDDNRVKILQRLREEGVIVKSELDLWLRDLNRDATVNIDAVLESLVKEGVVKGATVKALVAEVVFLTHDIVVYRRPPVLLINECTSRGLPTALKDGYQNEVRAYFSNYKPTEEDDLAIVRLVGNLDTYEILSLLREKIATHADLNLLKEKGLTDIDATLKRLWDCSVFSIFKDSAGTEYYALKTDIVVRKIFPEYLLTTIQREAIEHTKADAVLLEHLHILELTYNFSRETRPEPAL